MIQTTESKASAKNDYFPLLGLAIVFAIIGALGILLLSNYFPENYGVYSKTFNFFSDYVLTDSTPQSDQIAAQKRQIPSRK